MPPKREGNISAFFPPKDDTKGKSKVMDPTTDTPSDLPPPTPPKDEEKGKGKRPLSSPTLPTTTTKRQTKPTSSAPQTHFSPADLPPTWSSSNPSPPKDTPTLSITMRKGDLFTTAPPHTLLIHACNTQGSWGAGIARAFRDRYPKAYAIYRAYCTRTHDPVTNPVPTGTALLIAPVDAGKKHWIGCLFTSAKYGRAKARPEVIVRDTKPAMEMLLGLVRLAEEGGEEETEGVEGKVEDGEKKEKEGVREVRMCRINAGLFAVPWEKTVEALESIQVRDGWKGSVDVWEP